MEEDYWALREAVECYLTANYEYEHTSSLDVNVLGDLAASIRYWRDELWELTEDRP
jgi:hypothetical protein